jgi:putative oxidoreductase
LQRLFSTFAGGWPGVGLLLQRILTGSALVICGINTVSKAPQLASVVPQMIAATAGILIMFGLWSPVAGSLIAISEIWIAFSRASDPWIPTSLAILGASLAMIGPGALSVDARLFGRKHIAALDR